DRAVEVRMAEQKARRRQEPHSLPPDEDQLGGLVLALLQQCRGMPPYALLNVEPLLAPRYGSRSPYHLVLWRRGPDGREVRTGVRFLLAGHGNAATAALRWLREDPRPPERVLLVTEERRGLPRGARGEQHLERLRQRGSARFRHVALSQE